MKKSKKATGDLAETLMFPLEQYLDSSIQKYQIGTQEERLISAFQRTYKIDVKKLRNYAMTEYALPRGAIQLILDLD